MKLGRAASRIGTLAYRRQLAPAQFVAGKRSAMQRLQHLAPGKAMFAARSDYRESGKPNAGLGRFLDFVNSSTRTRLMGRACQWTHVNEIDLTATHRLLNGSSLHELNGCALNLFLFF